MSDYYCEEHKYNPPANSGLCFCPYCESGEAPAPEADSLCENCAEYVKDCECGYTAPEADSELMVSYCREGEPNIRFRDFKKGPHPKWAYDMRVEPAEADSTSETPRTDAKFEEVGQYPQWKAEGQLCDHAGQLERELAQAIKERDDERTHRLVMEGELSALCCRLDAHDFKEAVLEIDHMKQQLATAREALERILRNPGGLSDTGSFASGLLAKQALAEINENTQANDHE